MLLTERGQLGLEHTGPAGEVNREVGGLGGKFCGKRRRQRRPSRARCSATADRSGADSSAGSRPAAMARATSRRKRGRAMAGRWRRRQAAERCAEDIGASKSILPTSFDPSDQRLRCLILAPRGAQSAESPITRTPEAQVTFKLTQGVRRPWPGLVARHIKSEIADRIVPLSLVTKPSREGHHYIPFLPGGEKPVTRNNARLSRFLNLADLSADEQRPA